MERLFVAAHLVEAVADEIVDTVASPVVLELTDQPLIELDCRGEVRRLGEIDIRLTRVTTGDGVVVAPLELDGAALEVELAEAEHRVGRVRGIARVASDEALELLDGARARLVHQTLFFADLPRVPLVTTTALPEILAAYEGHDRVAIGATRVREASEFGFHLTQRGDLLCRGRRAVVSDPRVRGVEEGGQRRSGSLPRRSILDRAVLDGSILNRAVLDGSVLNRAVLDGSVLHRAIDGRIRGARVGSARVLCGDALSQAHYEAETQAAKRAQCLRGAHHCSSSCVVAEPSSMMSRNSSSSA